MIIILWKTVNERFDNRGRKDRRSTFPDYHLSDTAVCVCSEITYCILALLQQMTFLVTTMSTGRVGSCMLKQTCCAVGLACALYL